VGVTVVTNQHGYLRFRIFRRGQDIAVSRDIATMARKAATVAWSMPRCSSSKRTYAMAPSFTEPC